MKYRLSLIGAATTALLLAGTAHAGDPAFGGNSLTAKPSANMTNMTMTVSGPNGYSSKSFSKSGTPHMSLAKSGTMADGVYTWELTGATSKRVKANPMGLDNGRGAAAREYVYESASESGSFRVVNGSIMSPSSAVEEASPRQKMTPRNGR